MVLEAFKTSAPLTMGVELELQIVSPTDLDLVSGAEDLLELLERKPFPGEVKPEITSSMIEISTDPQSSYEPLYQQLIAARDALVAAVDRLNLDICGGGTHAFQRWYERRIYDKPRFKAISELYGYLAKQFTVFGQHVHIGCESADQALYLLHALNRYVPHFIALSASSPFSQGVDTLFDSARLNSVFAFPLSGRAPFLLTWADFEAQYFDKMYSTGIVQSMKDFYWDIRPKPEYGTIELRVCDTPLSIERAAALAAYLQVLCRWLLDTPSAGALEDDYLVYNFNRFAACRFGLDGIVIDPRSKESIVLRDDIRASVRRLAGAANDLGAQAALRDIEAALDTGNDALKLRTHYLSTGSMAGVVELAAREFRGKQAPAAESLG